MFEKAGGSMSSFRIVIKGRLSESFTAAVDPTMRHTADGGRTTLTGRLVDQAQLIGMINHLHGLGMQLISCEVIDDERRP